MKVLNVLRMVTFIVTLLTSVPLFVNHIKDIDPKYALVTELHVWFGLAFFIVAIISMILNKKREARQ